MHMGAKKTIEWDIIYYKRENILEVDNNSHETIIFHLIFFLGVACILTYIEKTLSNIWILEKYNFYAGE